MKLLQRYCYVFVCVLLLSVGFSTIALADETKLENLQIDIQLSSRVEGETYSNPTFESAELIIYPNNKTIEKKSTEFTMPSGNLVISQVWKISNKDGNILFKGQKAVNFRLENGYYNIGYTTYNGTTISSGVASTTYIVPKSNKFLVTYYDGTSEYFDIKSSSKYGRPTTIYVDFTPSKDVINIEIRMASTVTTSASKYYEFWCHTGEQTSDNSYNIIVDTESVEAGLLSGIIGWIKNIYDTIVNLPSKIWEFISEGLKSLFVPSEEYLEQFKSDMDTLLAEKLGAIYQVVNILFEGWDRIQANDSNNTIDVPEVTIPLPNDNEFTFGGQSVPIVPEGFEFLATAIKSVVGIVCTISFVNGLKKRYDDIMGG